MKSILSYLLLCIYASIMIKPVMPTIADTVAHIFNYSDHIATVHHHNGKYHVHYEYIEAAKKDAQGNTPCNNTPKKTNSSNEHILFTAMIDLSIPTVQVDHLNSIVKILPLIFLPDNFRPPAASFT